MVAASDAVMGFLWQCGLGEFAGLVVEAGYADFHKLRCITCKELEEISGLPDAYKKRFRKTIRSMDEGRHTAPFDHFLESLVDQLHRAEQTVEKLKAIKASDRIAASLQTCDDYAVPLQPYEDESNNHDPANAAVLLKSAALLEAWKNDPAKAAVQMPKAALEAWKDGKEPCQNDTEESDVCNRPRRNSVCSVVSLQEFINSPSAAMMEVTAMEPSFCIQAYIFGAGTALIFMVAISVCGFFFFDLYHEGETWRQSTQKDIWAAMGASQWMVAGSSLGSKLTPLEFQKGYCIVLWFTTLITGFGSEALAGIYLLKTLSPDTLGFFWKLAQFVFPLFIGISLQAASSQDAYCYVFLILGMWKFGFPEALVHLTKVWSREDGIIQTASDFCNGMGCVMHHSCSALCICLLQIGLVPLTQPIAAICLPLVLQHCVVMLKYRSLAVYAVLELVLEIIFEWEVISNLQFVTGHVWFSWVCVLGMLFAHWLYWLAAFLTGIEKLVNGGRTQDEGSEEEEDAIDEFDCQSRTSGDLSLARPKLSRSSTMQDFHDTLTKSPKSPSKGRSSSQSNHMFRRQRTGSAAYSDTASLDGMDEISSCPANSTIVPQAW